MIQSLHHVGVAVASLDEALPRYRDLGLRHDSTEEVPTEKVRVAVLFAGQQRIELLEPTADDSPIAKFLAKRGPGVHHLAFEVESTGAVMRVLMEEGVPFLSDAPRPGAHDTSVAFIHPKYLGGVLAELVELPTKEQAS